MRLPEHRDDRRDRTLEQWWQRVAVWGDEWVTYDSEWNDTTDQQVDRLWLNLLKWLSPPKVCQMMLPPLVLE